MSLLLRISSGLILLSIAQFSAASSPEDAKGLWMTAEKDGVVEFNSCADAPTALYGRVVWDKDAGSSQNTCGVQIAQLGRYDDEAWRDGWVYDPRDNKKYKGALRVKAGEMYLRAYLGTEILGQTEHLHRVTDLPTQPVCKP